MYIAKYKVCRYYIAGIDIVRLWRWHVTTYLTQCTCECVMGMYVTLLTYSVLWVSTSWSWRTNPCIFEWSDALSPNANGWRDLSCSRHEMRRWCEEGSESEGENGRKLEQYNDIMYGSNRPTHCTYANTRPHPHTCTHILAHTHTPAQTHPHTHTPEHTDTPTWHTCTHRHIHTQTRPHSHTCTDTSWSSPSTVVKRPPREPKPTSNSNSGMRRVAVSAYQGIPNSSLNMH